MNAHIRNHHHTYHRYRSCTGRLLSDFEVKKRPIFFCMLKVELDVSFCQHASRIATIASKKYLIKIANAC